MSSVSSCPLGLVFYIWKAATGYVKESTPRLNTALNAVDVRLGYWEDCGGEDKTAFTCEFPKELLADKPQKGPNVQFQFLFGQVDAKFIQSSGQGRVHVPHHLQDKKHHSQLCCGGGGVGGKPITPRCSFTHSGLLTCSGLELTQELAGWFKSSLG